MAEYLDIGEIVNTHGIRGELKVIPLTDDPGRYELLKSVMIGRDEPDGSYVVESIKFHKNTVLLKLAGIETLDDAAKLKGCYIKIDRKDAVKLPKDSYFIFDLIDCEVFDMQGRLLGSLTQIKQTGSNDVYIVKNSGTGKEILIPALKSVVKEIRIEEKIISVELPKGLVDDEI